jgi:hypothetical protein
MICQRQLPRGVVIVAVLLVPGHTFLPGKCREGNFGTPQTDLPKTLIENLNVSPLGLRLESILDRHHDQPLALVLLLRAPAAAIKVRTRVRIWVFIRGRFAHMRGDR